MRRGRPHFPPGIAGGIGDYITAPAYVAGGEPSLTASIRKVDNGYLLEFSAPPAPPTPEEQALIEKAAAEAEKLRRDQLDEQIEGMDAKIDAMVDGITAFMRYIQDKAAGEDWKQDEVKEKVREGFKAMFPQFNPQRELRGLRAELAALPPPGGEWRQESLVFGKLDDLVEFLKANL